MRYDCITMPRMRSVHPLLDSTKVKIFLHQASHTFVLCVIDCSQSSSLNQIGMSRYDSTLTDSNSKDSCKLHWIDRKSIICKDNAKSNCPWIDKLRNPDFAGIYADGKTKLKERKGGTKTTNRF